MQPKNCPSCQEIVAFNIWQLQNFNQPGKWMHFTDKRADSRGVGDSYNADEVRFPPLLDLGTPSSFTSTLTTGESSTSSREAAVLRGIIGGISSERLR